MIQLLKNLLAAEVSYVKEGANGLNFLVLKSKDGERLMKFDQATLEKILKGKIENEAELDEILKAAPEDKRDVVKAAVRLLNSTGIEGDVVRKAMVQAGCGYPKPTKKTAKVKKEDLAEEDLAAIRKEVKADMEKDNQPSKPSTNPVPVMKDGSLDLSGVPDEMKPIIEVIWKSKVDSDAKASNLEKMLSKEVDARITKEYNDKASQFENLGSNTEGLGRVLKALSADDEVTDILMTVLKAADAQLKESKITKEIGSGAGADVDKGTDAWEKIKKSANEFRKTDPKMSEADAITKFLDTPEGSKLYAEYEAAKQ
jgi:hypothetical protein